MSSTSLKHAMERIRTAPTDSPIAVFRSPAGECVNCVFANTVMTQKQIREGDPNYIGTFDSSSDQNWVGGVLKANILSMEEALSRAMRKDTKNVLRA